VWSQYDGYEAGYRPIDAYQKYLFKPLSITRIRRAVSLVADQPPDEARYQNNELGVGQSDMSDAQPLVSVNYGCGTFPIEIDEGGGGLSGAVTDWARLIAILISPKDSPALRRQTLKSMLSAGAQLNAGGGIAGYGFDGLSNQGGGQFYGQKGGSGGGTGAVLQFNRPRRKEEHGQHHRHD
jgi:CubicO group peptidase (beta-lactamase class C family)